MGRRRVCTVVNSRANYGRIKTVLQSIQDHPDLELQLIVGASALLHRFGSAVDVIRSDGFEPNSIVYSIVEGETPTTMAKSTGLGIVELATHFENLRPDLVLTVADRFETIATAIAASYMNIPVAHTQGGELPLRPCARTKVLGCGTIRDKAGLSGTKPRCFAVVFGRRRGQMGIKSWW